MTIEWNKVTWYSKLLAVVLFVLTFYIGFNLGKESAEVKSVPETVQLPAGKLITTASYFCNAGKIITASYYDSENKPVANPGEPPVPTGVLVLKLSDGRTMTLPQTISADGGRYANLGESIVFWNKGNGLTFTKNGKETYVGCLEVVNDPGGLTQVYENIAKGFSIRYGAGFTVDEKYTYQENGPGKDIAGVKFTIPVSFSSGTNLGSDSHLSVEKIPQAQNCTANLFLDSSGSPTGLAVRTVTDGDMAYSVASVTGAGAGNRYEETVYAIPGTDPCMAIRYFIHYGVLENYPAETTKQFDKQTLLDQFDKIRRTLVIAQ